MQYTHKITFYRESSDVVSNWTAGVPTIINPSVAAYLEITVAAITTSGNLGVAGIDENDQSINESVNFLGSGVKVSQNSYKQITSLTPSWSSFNINIKAVDGQGQPVLTTTNYGPYLCSVQEVIPTAVRGDVGIPGWIRGRHMRVYVEDFEPRLGESASLDNGFSGVCYDVHRAPLLFSSKGWTFYLVENPG